MVLVLVLLMRNCSRHSVDTLHSTASVPQKISELHHGEAGEPKSGLCLMVRLVLTQGWSGT